MRDKLIPSCPRGSLVTTPVGLGNSLVAFPRIAEYGNPGLEAGSPSGKCPDSSDKVKFVGLSHKAETINGRNNTDR